MKFHPWFISALAVAGAFAVAAQDSATPSAPAPGADASTAAAPKPRAKSKKYKSTPVDPPAAATVNQEVLNARGQPSFAGEVVTRLKKGDVVMVSEEITLASHEKGEPAKWDRISLPTNAVVWVDAQYIDPATQTVRAKRLNARGGPGENFSVLARLDKGTPVSKVGEQKGWIAIQAPASAYAYVAAEYLTMQPAVAPPIAAPPPVAVPVEPPPVAATSEPVAPPPAATSNTDAELAAVRQAEANNAAPAPAPAPAGAAAPEAAAPAPPRIVTREGYVHKSYNIQAPTDFELHDIQTDELTEYLQPDQAQRFKTFVGVRVSVTGQELLDPRWPRTPVLRVQSVELLP